MSEEQVQQEAPTSFKQRAMERLQAERGEAPQDEGTLVEQPEAIAEEAAPIQDDYEAGQIDSVDEEGLDTEQPETEDSVETLDESVAEPVEGSVEFWQAKADEASTEAEAFRKEVQADYTRKTQAIAESRNKLEDDLGLVEQTAQYQSEKARQALSQFQNVNWQQLQANPEQYQQMQQQWMAANQQVEQNDAEFKAIQERAAGIRETHRKREAEASVDVLKMRIPNWGPEKYAEIREHAVGELGYTEQEIDECTDWKLINACHRSMITSQNIKNTKEVKRTSVKAPTGRQNKPTGAVRRNAQGQFQSAREALRHNPGNKQASRDYFLNKLKAERGGR